MASQPGMVTNQMPGQPVSYDPIQPMNVAGGHSGAPKPWSSGLFSCFSDMGICCWTWCCPCVQYGRNYESMHGDGCFSQGCAWIVLAYCGLSCCIHKGLRSDIRRKWNLEEGCGDCLTTCCCPLCAVCQEAREIKTTH